ncbi:unnamed protein product, partial [Gulo gulo]
GSPRAPVSALAPALQLLPLRRARPRRGRVGRRRDRSRGRSQGRRWGRGLRGRQELPGRRRRGPRFRGPFLGPRAAGADAAARHPPPPGAAPARGRTEAAHAREMPRQPPREPRVHLIEHGAE